MKFSFAFYGRVSTEDQQDPASSRSWQLARARQLIDPHGGEITKEFFDLGQSRSLPWKRRPEAAALLESFKRANRGFGAVVIGEPARAFYGNQFGLTFPVFVHYGVALWVPEVGGRVDPGSDAHDLVMNLYGGMSKGERNRIKIRVRSAMAAQAASEGRFLGGRPPYGYHLVDAGPHPNPSKAADGKHLRRLAPDPAAAPIVRRIFAEYLAGLGLFAIAEGLTRDGVPCPSAHDPDRNRHRCGTAWSKSAVRTILSNPRYTGRQVWNRQRREEVLVDVEDVALGHDTKLRWNDRAEWVWSRDVTHEPLITAERFAAVQGHLGMGANRPATRKARSAQRSYLLRGLLFCGICGRRMQGQWNHGRAHYRCRFPNEYALANAVDHPRTVYLREDQIIPELDRWLAGVFDPEHLPQTCEALAAVSGPSEADSARLEAARRKVSDCDSRLERYRAALDRGGDPAVISTWIAEVQGERLVALKVIESGTADVLTPEDVRQLLSHLDDLLDVIIDAPADLKAKAYADLGVTLTYRPDERRVLVETVPQRCATERVGGGT